MKIKNGVCLTTNPRLWWEGKEPLERAQYLQAPYQVSTKRNDKC